MEKVYINWQSLPLLFADTTFYYPQYKRILSKVLRKYVSPFKCVVICDLNLIKLIILLKTHPPKLNFWHLCRLTKTENKSETC